MIEIAKAAAVTVNVDTGEALTTLFDNDPDNEYAVEDPGQACWNIIESVKSDFPQAEGWQHTVVANDPARDILGTNRMVTLFGMTKEEIEAI